MPRKPKVKDPKDLKDKKVPKKEVVKKKPIDKKEKTPKEIDSPREDPNAKMERLYGEYQEAFSKDFVTPFENEMVEKITGVLNALDLGDPNHPQQKDLEFSSWGPDKLISAREKLARYSEPLGEFISAHEARSDFAYIWRKGAYASDWAPMKTHLSNTMDKVTNPEVDSALTKKYLGEQFYSMFHRRRADLLERKLKAVDRMLRTLDHRLRELSRQQGLPQDPNFKPNSQQ